MQLFDTVSKNFKLSLSIYIPLEVDATNIDTPHFIRTTSSILALISTHSHPPTHRFQTHTNSRTAIPWAGPSSPTQEDEDKDKRSTLRLSALEFMISLSEARLNMVRKVSGWT